jgi:hypothetical protein
MAAALWAAAAGDPPPIGVLTAGGDELRVGLTARGSGDSARWEVSLSGPAEVAYRGEWTEVPSAAAARA